MPSIEKNQYDVYCISRRQDQRFLNVLFWGCLSCAVGSVGVWCSARGVAEVAGSYLARGKYLQHLSTQLIHYTLRIYLLSESASVSDPV